MIYTRIDKGKDIHIFDFLNKLGANASGYSAIYLFISKIRNYRSRVQQIQSIMVLFDNIVRKNGGGLFSLYNDDLVVIFNKKNIDVIKAALIKIRYMFNDDPLVRGILNISESKLAVPFDLEKDIKNFKQFVRNNMEAYFEKNEDNKSKIVSNVGLGKNLALNRKDINITPAILAKMQKVLAITDFSNLIRRQPVCIIIGSSPPNMLFDEVYVSINDLKEILFPEVDLTSNTWLFRSLTETLDKRVLSTIRLHDDGSLNGNFSVNINVSTVLSDDFLTFDEHFNTSSRSTITLEFNIIDVISDVKAFILAQTFAQYRGYKICIDGITADTLKYVNNRKIDCDLLKIIWHQDLMDVIKTENIFGEKGKDIDSSKIILSWVDDPQAIEFGQSIGINLYQGRYITKLAKPK